MLIGFRSLALSMTLIAVAIATGENASWAYDASSAAVQRGSFDEGVKSSLSRSQNERQQARSPYALVDLSNGLLPDGMSRDMLLEDAASCLKTIALLKKQAKKLEKRSKGAQWVAFSAADHLQLEGSIGKSLRLFRIFECKGRTLGIGSFVETPQVPPPPPPPPPAVPES